MTKDKFLRTNKIDHWLELIITERFGHVWGLSRNEKGVELRLQGAEGSIQFDTECEGFTKAGFFDLPCSSWDIENEGWEAVLDKALPAPGVSLIRSPLIEKRNGDHVIHYDILGLVYWMLARVEEIGRDDLDAHDRFPATSSHAYKHGYLERPIVDEWLHVLGQVIQRQWPNLELKKHFSKIHLSHDVDHPSRYGFASFTNLGRRIIGDIFRGNIKSALTSPLVRLGTKSRLHSLDAFNTFDWIMNESERHGLKSVFNFICGHTSSMDGEYQIKHPAIRKLLRAIHERGHEIGLHPSYNTYLQPEAFQHEFVTLKKVCEEEGVCQTDWGVRMHYLRWKQPETLNICANLGITYESSLGYADYAGFRCGTCFEFPAFDPIKLEPLSIRIRPLIVMEGSVLSKKYMGRNEEEAFELIMNLKRKCHVVGGAFSLLWHNSELTKWKTLYSNVLQA